MSIRSGRLRMLIAGLGLATTAAANAGEAPLFGRYMPLYPGQYLQLSYSVDAGDAVFDGRGRRIDTAVPSIAGRTRLPRNTLRGTLSWHMPLFESYAIPFLSSRTHLFSVSWEQVDTVTDGALVDFITNVDDDATSDADDLRNNGRGVGDMTVEFGSYLYGSPTAGWRSRTRTPLAVLFKFGGTLNFGEHDRDAPANAGDNTPAFHAALGVHAQPWPRGFVDIGLRYREYFKNQDPAFGALWPTQRGDDISWDISLAQRLLPGLFLSGFYTWRDGAPSAYRDVRFAPNQPPPPDESADTYPTPGQYEDGGTALATWGLGLSYFVTQRVQLGLHWTRPLDGQSSEIDLQYTERRPRGCTVGAAGCTTTAGETRLTDGFGPGRVMASDRIMLSLSFQFLERDIFDCVGCSDE